MSLPDLIEIVPLREPVQAEITVPGSKSITNRALILAALAKGTVTLEGALWSEDTQVMVECLHKLGFKVDVAADPNETCNRTITVEGRGGNIPKSGTAEQPLELFVGNAGTAARFLAAMVCLGSGVYRLSGVPRMHERPQAALFEALRELGYRIDSPNNKLPAVIHGTGPRAGKCRVSIEDSSQFASALLLSGGIGQWQVEVRGENAEESPYVAMTSKLMTAFPVNGGHFQIEPDASSGSYFWAAGQIQLAEKKAQHSADGVKEKTKMVFSFPVHVAHWPESDWQIDQSFRKSHFDLFERTQGFIDALLTKEQQELYHDKLRPNEQNRLVISRRDDLGDSIMTAIVLAPFCREPIRFTDLGRLRVQECERVVALRTELTKCGAKVVETGDTLEVYPSQLHGAEIETYNDHRMAMCFAVVGLRVPGIKLRNPSCVKKTFPNFFQKLAAETAHGGLGVTILDAHGNKLSHDDLFAA